MKKNVYIIGARGFGRELALELPSWNGFCEHYTIKGFLDDKSDALEAFCGYPPIVSSVEAFEPHEDDVVVCGLGAVKWRVKYINLLREKNCRFETFIAPTARIKATAKIGDGVVILSNSSVSADVVVADFVLCHPNVTLGHDTRIGKHSVIENGVFCGGFVEVGEEATLHTRATVLPSCKIGEHAVVGACSCVIGNVKANVTVFGNPARKVVF